MSPTVSGTDIGYQYEFYLGPLGDGWSIIRTLYRHIFYVWDTKQYGRIFIATNEPFKIDIAPDLVEWFEVNNIQWYVYERYALDSVRIQIDTAEHAMMFKLRWLVDI